ncbi:SDR family oxidoreductase [Propionivibrio sp.]|uniref:SDR family oxidoreductase n=1 Tax=Propionivibrio sp. TaxID=2212460 RepID=UPI0039E58A82
MQTLLMVGCGDVARRTLPHLLGRYRVVALLRDPAQAALWRARGALPLIADLDRPASLRRLAGLADAVLHFAPPPESGPRDSRMRRLLAALSRGLSLPRRLVYISTSGVYGDCGGAPVAETRPPRPLTARARRRVDAERQLRRFGRDAGVRVSILRAPGIYAADRLPLDRLRRGTPALREEDDVFTNHIHADDLARLACAALRRGGANRVYNAADESRLKMGDYFDLVADRFGLPRPPRISRQEAEKALSPVQLSFMSESRRLDNGRLRRELGVRLRYPDIIDGLDAARRQGEANGVS